MYSQWVRQHPLPRPLYQKLARLSMQDGRVFFRLFSRNNTPAKSRNKVKKADGLFRDFTNARKPAPRLALRAFFYPQKNISEHGTLRGVS